MANVRYPGTASTTPGTITASDVTYDNTTSGLTADDVQEAIDEIEGQIGGLSYDASDISYDNTTSGLTADDVQEALDEIDGNVDTLSGKVYKTDDSTITAIASDDLLPIYDTSATAAKKITLANVVKATVSNPNLIDNPWFTVNQRRQSSYTYTSSALYTVDRWIILNSGISLTVNNDNTITINNTSGDIYGIEQKFENDLEAGTYTVTANVTSGTIPFIRFYDDNYTDIGGVSGSTGTVTFTNSNCKHIFVYVNAGSSITLKAVKLEKGSISTLALDTAPNYATELLKCQRYFVRIGSAENHYMALGIGQARTTTSFSCQVPLTSMRIYYPSVSITGTISIRNGSTWSNISTATLDSALGPAGVVLSMESTGLTAGQVYEAFVTPYSYIDFIADL